MNTTLPHAGPAQTVFETRWFSIDAQPWGADAEAPYYSLSCRDSAAILALTPDQRILLVRQYRPPQNDYVLELPAGYVDPDESALAAVERELREETGYVCRTVRFLGTYKIAPSRIRNSLYLFFGSDARQVEPQAVGDREIEVVRLPRAEFPAFVSTGRFQEIAGLAAWWLAQQKGLL